jgi:2-methylcitrate dehydratase PrpD
VTVAEELAAWAVRLRPGDVPEPVQRAVGRHLLDGVGNSIGSRLQAAVEPALVVGEALGGPAEAAPLGSRGRLSAPAAALVDGALVHGLDFDDTHAGGLIHATAVVLPTAFAVGQQVGASGADVATAAVVGYEVACRVAAAVPHGFHRRGIHATHAAGTIAAASVAARLMGLNVARTVDALGVAGSASGGLLEFLDTGSSTKQLHPGTASMAGVLAARLAAAGASGPGTVLEGRRGVWAALADGEPDVASVTKGLGDHWESTQITLKPYPACQLLHVTLDALVAALDGARIDPDDIIEVVAQVHPDSAAIVCEPSQVKTVPRSAYDAKFSLPWSVAALLVDGVVDVSTYASESMARENVSGLAQRVRSRLMTSEGVAADAPGAVEVRLTDGRVLVGAVPHSAGGPGSPLDDAALDAKVARLCGEGPLVEGLIDVVRGLWAAPDLDVLHELAAAAVENADGGAS